MSVKKNNNIISGFWSSDSKASPEMMMREAFLRTVKEVFDGVGIESYSIEQVRGATTMLEKFIEIREEK